MLNFLFAHTMNIYLHQNDLPNDIIFGNTVGIDTEAMGLNHKRDRLCVVQISNGDGDAHLVQIPMLSDDQDLRDIAPRLYQLITNKDCTKIFHYARFDVGILQYNFRCVMKNIYCTKIASRLCRTYANNHSLKDICRELLEVSISKQQTSSDWGRDKLTKAQMEYAASDVIYLHQLRRELDKLLKREGRCDIARECFAAIPTIAKLDALGWDERIFCHNYYPND